MHTVAGASMSRTRRSVTFAHRVERMLRADSFEVIHAVSPCGYADLYQPRGGTVAETIERNLALRRPGAVRGLKRYANHFNVKQRYMLKLERKLLGDRDGPIVVAISGYVARQLKHHYALPDERIRTIFNGVDIDSTGAERRERDRASIRAEFGLHDDDFLVLLMAHNFSLKGVHCWMEAAALLRERGVHNLRTLVLGRGESQRWHRLAAHLGIAEVLTFVGPTERVHEFQHAADVLVHPTFYDPCSRVVLEAMVSGLPCVTTRWDGAAEMIVDGVNGYVLNDPGDVEALAERVDGLRDATHRHRLGDAAKTVADRVSMKRHAVEMLRLYQELRREARARR